MSNSFPSDEQLDLISQIDAIYEETMEEEFHNIGDAFFELIKKERTMLQKEYEDERHQAENLFAEMMQKAILETRKQCEARHIHEYAALIHEFEAANSEDIQSQNKDLKQEIIDLKVKIADLLLGFAPRVETVETPGFIYIITDGTNIKIGNSKDPQKRCKQLQTSNPNNLSIVGFYPSDTPQLAEKLIHKRLSEYQVLGEWFDLEPKRAISLILDLIL